MTKIVITAAVIVHLVASLWHGSAHTHLGIGLSTQQTLFVYLIIIIAPVIAGILVWTRYASIGLWVFFLAMLESFLFGVYHLWSILCGEKLWTNADGRIDRRCSHSCLRYHELPAFLDALRSRKLHDRLNYGINNGTRQRRLPTR
jgi:hypothetical protein